MSHTLAVIHSDVLEAKLMIIAHELSMTNSLMILNRSGVKSSLQSLFTSSHKFTRTDPSMFKFYTVAESQHRSHYLDHPRASKGGAKYCAQHLLLKWTSRSYERKVWVVL